MSKKVRSIVIGLIVIIALVGVLVVLKLNPPKPQETAQSSSTAESTAVTLIDHEPADFVSLKIKNEKDEYTISSQGENLWGIKEIMDFPQETTMYSTAIAGVYNVTASSTVEANCQDLDKFGLKTPPLTFEAKFTGDKTYNIDVGNLSSDGSTRYVCVSGKNDVYGFSSMAFSSLFMSRYDYLLKEVIPAFDQQNPDSIPQMEYYSVMNPNLKEPIVLEKVNADGLSVNAVAPYSMTMTKPVNSLINETQAQKYILGNFGLTALEIVKANPTATELSEYGFDKPTSELSMKYNATSSVKITTGKGIECTHDPKEVLEEGHKHKIVSYYAIKDGVDLVYVLDAAAMPWFTLENKSLLSTIAVLPHVLDIDTIDITVEGKKHTLDFIDGSDPTDASLLTSKFDGKLVSAEYAKKYLQLLYMTVIQDINVDKTTTKPADATIEYKYKDGKGDKVEFFVLDDLSCILSLNGNMAFTARAAMVDKLSKETQTLLQNKEIDADW